MTDGGRGFSGRHLSKHAKKKISLSNRGRKLSEAGLQRKRDRMLGSKNHMYGKHLSKKAIKLLSEKAKERFRNKENHPMYGRHFSDDAKQKMSKSQKNKSIVIQYDLDKNIVAEFQSIGEAARQTNIGRSGISECCRGIIKSAGGFLWSYKNVEDINKRCLSKTTPSKSVLQYNLEGILIKEYKSIRAAERETGVRSQNICACCRGTYKTSGGYIWRYKGE